MVYVVPLLVFALARAPSRPAFLPAVSGELSFRVLGVQRDCRVQGYLGLRVL